MSNLSRLFFVPILATLFAATCLAQVGEPEMLRPGSLRKFEDVVTKEAVSQSGMFRVHRIDDRILFEIPPSMMNRELLWQTEVAEVPQNVGYPGAAAGSRVVVFTRRKNKVYLRNVDFSIRTGEEGARKVAIDANSVSPILMAFNVLTENGDHAAVIDVTNLFTSDPQDFTVRDAIGTGGADPSRSYVDRIKAFADNIEVRSFITFGAGMSSFSLFGGGRTGTSSSISATVHYSIVALPEKPMMGRLKDSRIGYFTTAFTEYGRQENRPVAREFIDRFRLEKKYPNQAISDPVKPIVFYLSREVPEKWRPYLKKAVEDWRPAFETAGFSNAISCVDAPSKDDDPNWDPEDVRYSVIRWAPSTTQNAMGPSIQDPRSSETISAHIIVWDNVVDLAETWYFSQVAATDPQSRKLPLSDELMGTLLRYVVAHEVGHTLGLEHNFKASSAYTIAQLRDPRFTREHGVAASIMSYSRFNYVAQPGDGVTQWIGMIGPYDKFAIHYGYTPIPEAKTPDDERKLLDKWLSEQVSNPWLRFGNYRYPQDPTTLSERIGDDPVEAARLGLLNIDRIADNYLYQAGTKFGEDYSHLNSLYAALRGQRLTELMHVLQLLGGVVEIDYHAGRGSDVFKPVPAAQQKRAVKFLLDHAFHAPRSLFNGPLLYKIEPEGALYSVNIDQTYLLNAMLFTSTVRRIQDNEALNGNKAYRLSELVDDLTDGIWSELAAAHPNVELYRRFLQRTFLATMDNKLNGSDRDDLRIYARAALQKLAQKIDVASHRTVDRVTSLHLKDCRKQIETILLGKSPRAGGSTPMLMSPFGISLDKKGCYLLPPIPVLK